MSIQADQRTHVAGDVPVIDPRDARREGTFLTSRKGFVEFVIVVREFVATMVVNPDYDDFTLAASWTTASRVWTLWLMPKAAG